MSPNPSSALDSTESVITAAPSIQTAPPIAVEKESLFDKLGLPKNLWIGYVGLLLFMLGDGCESGFLSHFLSENGISTSQVALLYTLYGIVGTIGAWFAAALSNLWSPRRVMIIGFIAWVVMDILFLTFGLPHFNYPVILAAFALRGLGYPFFAFGFLVWITAATKPDKLCSAIGWFWFSFTGGMLAIGPFLASRLIPAIGLYQMFWFAFAAVITGGLVTLLGVRDPIGKSPLAKPGEKPLQNLIYSLSILWQRPKTAVCCVLRIINAAPVMGFLVFLPIFFTQRLGFTLSQWLQIMSCIYFSNIIANLIFGIVGNKLGWLKTMAIFGGIGNGVTTLMLYYLPVTFQGNFLIACFAGACYGFTLAGFIPLAAVVSTVAGHNKGAGMAALNLGSGLCNCIGPGLVGIFLPRLGVGGVMWIFASMYFVSVLLTSTLRGNSDYS